MEAESLREELLGLPGVAEAEVDGEDAAPSGVRIRLAPEADPRLVGAEVQRVLSGRGVRSRVGGAETVPVGPLAPGPAERGEEPGGPAGPAARSLHSLVVEEGASGLQVTAVSGDGRRVSRRVAASEEALVGAAVAAVGELLEGAEPRVLGVEWVSIDGSRVVTLVLEGRGGHRGAGAALVRASAGYAAARAAWSALSD